MSDVPWGGFAAGVNDALQALALLVAGAFGYARYVRGRVHHAGLTLAVTGAIVRVGDREALDVATAITNSGTLRIVFGQDCAQGVTAHCLTREQWSASEAGHSPDGGEPLLAWDQLVDTEGFRDLTVEYEPGDSNTDRVLIPLPEGDWVAVLLRFLVRGQARSILTTSRPWDWETTALITR